LGGDGFELGVDGGVELFGEACDVFFSGCVDGGGLVFGQAECQGIEGS